MVQTRSQAKDVKASTTKDLACSMQKKAKDIKPIIIDDGEEQDIPNLDKYGIVMNKKVTSHKTPPRIPNQVYSQPIIRLPPRPPDSSESNPKVRAQIEANLDFHENSPHQEGIIIKMYESPDRYYQIW